MWKVAITILCSLPSSRHSRPQAQSEAREVGSDAGEESAGGGDSEEGGAGRAAGPLPVCQRDATTPE
eukprot:502396-Hanusia_phi.AAC.1